MEITSTVGRSHPDYARLPASISEPRWYVVYTSANHEKSVAGQLENRLIQHFLPLYESMRWWKDRQVRLRLPLFPGYVFVRLALCDRLRVLEVPGVVRLVGFGGILCALPDEEIRAIQGCLSRGCLLEPHPYVHVGHRVRVNAGPLQGLEGVVVRKKNRVRFVLSLELINRSASVEIDAADLEQVSMPGKVTKKTSRS